MNTERPNILFLLTDMQRYDALGFNGNAVCKTPAIDRIAERACVFAGLIRPLLFALLRAGRCLRGCFRTIMGSCRIWAILIGLLI